MCSSDLNELPEGWGAVIVSDVQDNLKRVDVILVWQEYENQNGRPILDENGRPTIILDESGNPVLRVNSQHIFIHENSQYFAAPGT